MKPNIHYNPIKTAAQAPSHTARRLLYAQAALNNEIIGSVDVPSAYPRAPGDPHYRIIMRQPRRSDRTIKYPGKDVLFIRVQMCGPDGSYL